MSLIDIAKAANKSVTKRFKVTYYDKDAGLIKEEVLQTNSEEYNQIMPLAMDKEYDNITGEWVSDDTPIGVVGNAKVLKVRNGERTKMELPIHYQLQNGIPRFRDFKSFKTLGYKVVKHSTSDGDILALQLPSSEIEPLEHSDIKNLRHLLLAIQLFNNEMLAEASDDNLDDEKNAKKKNNDDNIKMSQEKYKDYKRHY